MPFFCEHFITPEELGSDDAWAGTYCKLPDGHKEPHSPLYADERTATKEDNMGYTHKDDKHPDPPVVTTEDREADDAARCDEIQNQIIDRHTNQLPSLEIGYGRQTFPDNLRAVWGARLIWPNDLVHDRQDLAAHDDAAKSELIAWLNGTDVISGRGALYMMREALKLPTTNGLRFDGSEEIIVYEDDIGKIIGSAQSSHGYVYVAGWLKAHEQ